MNQIQLAIEFDLKIEVTILMIGVSVINIFLGIFTNWNNIFFAIVWIDEFGNQCKDFQNTNLVSHTKYCLKNFECLQKSLGKVHKVQTYFFTN